MTSPFNANRVCEIVLKGSHQGHEGVSDAFWLLRVIAKSAAEFPLISDGRLAISNEVIEGVLLRLLIIVDQEHAREEQFLELVEAEAAARDRRLRWEQVVLPEELLHVLHGEYLSRQDPRYEDGR